MIPIDTPTIAHPPSGRPWTTSHKAGIELAATAFAGEAIPIGATENAQVISDNAVQAPSPEAAPISTLRVSQWPGHSMATTIIRAPAPANPVATTWRDVAPRRARIALQSLVPKAIAASTP